MKLHEKSLIGKRVYGYNTFRGCENFDTYSPVENCDLKEDTKSAQDSLLDSIYCLNPLTGLPDCDISVFLSKNTSDSVRKFIQDNLLLDNGGSVDTSKFPNLSDDVIAQCTRSSSETIYQYRDRMVQFIRENHSKDKEDDKS